ncbi:MAG: hypothetical protein MJ192_04395 [Clostridia bacterium]|nr:hypothetical protein [Clostridia bacterium]
MKKIIAFVICTVMILSLVPAAVLNASAAGEGDWTTYRRPSDYEPAHESDYAPNAGYLYTSEGLSTVSPDFTGCTVFYTVQTKDKVDVRDGVFMEFRIDDFSYAGEEGKADEWITVSLWDKQNLEPGLANHGSGICALIRGTGNGSATVHDCICTEGASFAGTGGQTAISCEMDSEDKEYYTFQVVYDGSDYSFMMNGTTLQTSKQLSNQLKKVSEDGEFYVGITFHSTVAGGTAALTITQFGTDEQDARTPAGTDSAEAEENINVVAEIADPSTVPEGQPALLFNTAKTSFSADPAGSGIELTPKGDESYHVKAIESNGFFTWKIRPSLSYAAQDFPVVGMMLRNYFANVGSVWYCAGDVLAAGGDTVTSWETYGEDNGYYEIGDDEYVLVLLDLTDLWEGRINALRMDFNGLSAGEEWGEWDICYIGMYRSVEDAQKCGDDYVAAIRGTDETEGDATSAATDAPTEKPTEAPTDAPVTAADDTGAADTADGAGTGAGDEGCKSVIGGCAALILTAAAAAVSLRRKH